MTSLRHLARGLPDLVTAYALYAAWSEPARFGMQKRVAGWLRAVFVTVEFEVPELGVSEELRNDWDFTGGGVVYFGLMAILRPLLAWGFSPRDVGTGAPA